MKLLTDYFQSCELVKAGVPKESADYFYFNGDAIDKERITPTFPYTPCWSIAALWEFLHEHDCELIFTFDTEQSTESLVESLVNAAVMVMKQKDGDVETK